MVRTFSQLRVDPKATGFTRYVIYLLVRYMNLIYLIVGFLELQELTVLGAWVYISALFINWPKSFRILTATLFGK
jgi:hypothetical protein